LREKEFFLSKNLSCLGIIFLALAGNSIALKLFLHASAKIDLAKARMMLALAITIFSKAREYFA